MKLFQNKIVKNAGWLIGGKIAQSVLAFIIGILTARYLGPSNYGTISYAASVVAFVGAFVNLGLGNVLVQEFTNHPDEEGKIIGTSIIMSIFSALTCILGVTVYTFCVDVGDTVTNVVVILYGIMLIAQAFEIIQYWYQYKLLSKYMSVVSLIAYIIISIYKFILLATGQSVYWFAIAYSIDYFIIAIALLVIYKKLRGEKISFDWNIGKRMLSSSKHYIVSGIMMTIFAQTDRVMIKLMIDKASVGYYSAAVNCAVITQFVFTAVIDSFRPVIFQAKKDNNEKSYTDNLVRLNSIVVYLSLLQSIAFTVFAPLVINILYGADYTPAIKALQIVVWYTTFSYLGSVRNVWVLAENKQKYLWILNLAGALMNVVLNYFLIPVWGIYGAAVASLITQIFTNIIMNVIVWPLRHCNRYILKALNPKALFSILKRS